MVEIGNLSQITALGLSAGAIVLLIGGIRRNDFRLIMSGTRALATTALFTTAAAASLTYLFATDAFQVRYVMSYSDRALPFFYKLTAFWAGQEGSLLFWVWVLSLFAVIVAFNTRDELDRRPTPFIYLVMAGCMVFFLVLLTMVTNPFELLPYASRDGRGLNPMLQNPGMIFHPPTLFLGYVGFTVPFAYALGTLLAGDPDGSWLRKTRVWNVLSWIFLSIGIILGGQWAYVELGWGGFWAWDPVENASFIPWLVATAFIHTAIIQERRNIMKVWNMVLIVMTFVLCIFGTYLVRSGVLQSVHDFGATGLGGFFLLFMGGAIVLGGGLIVSRLDKLRSGSSLESYLSRESSFLFNNVILLALAFATLFGTLFPLISEAVTGDKVTVSQPFFNLVNTPLFLALLLITGLCPLLGWHKASPSNLKKNFLMPAAAAAAGAAALFAAGVHQLYPLLALSLAAFVGGTIFQEFWSGTRARMRLTGESAPVAFPRLLWKMRRRYGGFTAHLGVVLMVVGITGSYAYKQENQATLLRGQTIEVGDYTLRYDRAGTYTDRNRDVVAADFSVFRKGQYIDRLRTEKRYYLNAEQPTTEVSLRSTLMEDLYVTTPAIGQNREVTVKVTVNPLMAWVWIGSVVMILGGALAIIPGSGRSRRTVNHV